MLHKQEYNYGGKGFICQPLIHSLYPQLVLLPPSALPRLMDLISDDDLPSSSLSPMMFRLAEETKGTSTHCGVLEFIADEGRVYAPEWVFTS